MDGNLRLKGVYKTGSRVSLQEFHIFTMKILLNHESRGNQPVAHTAGA